MNRKGFTLVELSIVLVIIGLLIGGILSAKSMIETAKIQNMVRQIQQLDVAVSNFKTSYNSLPGDSPYFTMTGSSLADQYSPNGNNNGYIDIINTYAQQDWCSNTGLGCNRFDGEIASFYPELNEAGFYPGNYKADVPIGGFNSDLDNLNAPIVNGPDGKVEFIPVPCARPDSDNCYQVAQYNGLFSNNYGSTSYGEYLSGAAQVTTAAAMYAIDEKIDDGMPLTGTIQNIHIDDHPNQQPNECNNWATNGNNAATAQYVLQNTNCNFSVGILGQVPNK